MRPPILALTCLTLARGSAYSQTKPPPSFEVASIKPASPAQMAISCSGGPGTTSPGIFRCSNVPLALLISRAYGFQAYQFTPRAPCCQDRFDVSANVPPGATKQQFQRMLQTLLVERLKLKLHYEQKRMTVYELTIAENGSKLKESAPDASPAPEDPWAPPEYHIGKDGYPEFPPGRGGVAGAGSRYRWTGFSLPMEEIAKTLSFYLGAPVLDATGLTGKYDLNMTWTIDLAWLLERAGHRDEIPDLADDGPRGPTLIRAVQDQLGLKLTSKKGPGDVVVVDHVEKVPIEN